MTIYNNLTYYGVIVFIDDMNLVISLMEEFESMHYTFLELKNKKDHYFIGICDDYIYQLKDAFRDLELHLSRRGISYNVEDIKFYSSGLFKIVDPKKTQM